MAPLAPDPGEVRATATARGLHLGLDPLGLDGIDFDALLGDVRGPSFARSRVRPAGVIPAQKRSLEVSAGQFDVEGRARPSAQNSTAHGSGLAGGRVGERLQFTVTVVSEDGLVYRGRNVRVTAQVVGVSLVSKAFPEPRPWVDDSGDGLYTVQFVCASPGPYDITAFVNGVPLPFCPCRIDVLPGPPSALHCEIEGEGAYFCNQGHRAQFLIQARDEFGDICDRGGARFGVRAAGHAKLHEVVDNEDGTYSVIYSVPDWASGPVRLEVMLDGVPIKASPLTPQVRFAEATFAPSQFVHVPDEGADLAERLRQLRWLQENPPAEPPSLPPLSLASGPRDAPGINLVGTGTDASASRVAWRAADEWKRLTDVRSEMDRCRNNLLEHQALLLSVGASVHEEFNRIQDRSRVTVNELDHLEGVQNHLEELRRDVAYQYKNLGGVDRGPPLDDLARTGSPWPTALGSPEPGGRLVTFAPSPTREDIAPLVFSPPRRPESPVREDPIAELAELKALRQDLEQKRRWLQQLEDDDHSPAIPSSPMRGNAWISPLPAPAPPQGRGRGQIWEPLPPPAPPPALSDTLPEPASELSPFRNRGPVLAPGLLTTPPPPPAPPPGGDGSWHAGARAAGGNRRGGASTEEVGQAMRKLFHTFASGRTGGVMGQQRPALSLQDYQHLARAAQLQLAGGALDECFNATARQYQTDSDSGQPLTLPFELFVELLISTADRRYGELVGNHEESMAALLEEHLLPLARHIEEDGGGFGRR